MRYRGLYAIAATVLAISALSCKREEICLESGGVEMSFVATYAEIADTRTVLDHDGSVLWSPADEVSVFAGSGSSGGSRFVSQNSEPAATVEFKGFLEGLGALASGQYFWAIYPYNSGNSCDGQGITATLPHEQTARRGSFGNGCHPTIARNVGTDLAFYSITGGLEFTVSRPGVRSVSIKGNNGEALAGIYTATFGSDGKPLVEVKSAEQEVMLTAPDGSAFIPGETYVISLLPASLSRGITVTLVTDDNKRGTLVSGKPQTVKRSVLGRIPDLDLSINEWSDIPVTTEGGGTRTGLYLGIIGFNQQLYKMGIEQLNTESKPRFDSFVSGLTSKNGTLLYYSVDDAIRTLQKAQYPTDLFNVSLITFTDGLDQGSSMLIDNYPGDSEYLGILHNRLASSSVAGLPLTSYSVGLKGNDVTDVNMFRSNLRQLSYPESNAYEVSDMSSVNSRFQEIANQVNQKLTSTKYTLSLTIPGQANGTRMRFTLDGPNVTGSSIYIEGVFNLNTKSLTDVTYHGLTCSSGGTVVGQVSGIFVTFTFADIVPSRNWPLYKDDIFHWLYVPSSGIWQKNSEFSAANNANVTVTIIKKSAVVLLNLDCSKSLGDQFSTLQTHAKSFIARLYEASYDPTEVLGVSLDKSNATLYVGNTLTLKATVTPSSASNKNVTWSSSDDGVVIVSASGVVTAVGPGTATITATTVEGGFTASCEITVNQLVESLTLDKTSIEIYVSDEPTPLTATLLPENASNKGLTWSSSNKSVVTVDENGRVMAVSNGSATITVKTSDGSGKQASCAVTVRTHVTSIVLNMSEASLYIGETLMLSATVLPTTASDKGVSWSSGDDSIVTVSSSGEVMAVSLGSTIITTTTVDGNYTASCAITVKDFEYVDLGLSVKWASFNVGATKPWQIGDYFAWGETEPKSGYDWTTYMWCNRSPYANSTRQTKYNTKGEFGTVDNKIFLDPEDDAARANWGGKWRMPTEAECAELINNCIWTSTDNYNDTGVAGEIVKSRYSDKSIFLPVSGHWYWKFINDGYSYYWSSSLDTDSPDSAKGIYFYGPFIGPSSDYRYRGQPVRPVIE